MPFAAWDQKTGTLGSVLCNLNHDIMLYALELQMMIFFLINVCVKKKIDIETNVVVGDYVIVYTTILNYFNHVISIIYRVSHPNRSLKVPILIEI